MAGKCLRRGFAIAALAATLAAPPVGAGQTCSETPPAPEAMQKTFRLALKVREQLERADASLLLIGRVGQDLSKYRLRYSHAALLWRDHPAGRWLVVHALNDCGSNRSELFNEGLANFFADDLFAWEALLITPSPDLQARLAKRLGSGAAADLHEPSYNMLAFPFSTKYQNSNQWVLEVLAEALADTTFLGRGEAQGWLQANGYRPTALAIPAMTRLGARMFRANIAFDDHPDEQRFSGRIDTVTVESLAAFVRDKDPEAKRVVIRLP